MMTENPQKTVHHIEPRPVKWSTRVLRSNLKREKNQIRSLFKEDDKASSSVKISACFENSSQSVESDIFRHDERENVCGQTGRQATGKPMVGDNNSRKILHLDNLNHQDL